MLHCLHFDAVRGRSTRGKANTMSIFLIALIEAVAVIAILLLGRVTLGRHIPIEWPKIGRWLGITFAINYLLSLLILYFAQPALTGPYGGWQDRKSVVSGK